MNIREIEKMKGVSVGNFRRWLQYFIVKEKNGKIPNKEDWKRIKSMVDRIIDPELIPTESLEEAISNKTHTKEPEFENKWPDGIRQGLKDDLKEDKKDLGIPSESFEESSPVYTQEYEVEFTGTLTTPSFVRPAGSSLNIIIPDKNLSDLEKKRLSEFI